MIPSAKILGFGQDTILTGALLSGFVDGEGCFYLSITKKKRM